MAVCFLPPPPPPPLSCFVCVQAVDRLLEIVKEEAEELPESADGKRTLKIEVRRWNADIIERRTLAKAQLKKATAELREYNQAATEVGASPT